MVQSLQSADAAENAMNRRCDEPRLSAKRYWITRLSRQFQEVRAQSLPIGQPEHFSKSSESKREALGGRVTTSFDRRNTLTIAEELQTSMFLAIRGLEIKFECAGLTSSRRIDGVYRDEM
jgi:hypothetical protein